MRASRPPIIIVSTVPIRISIMREGDDDGEARQDKAEGTKAPHSWSRAMKDTPRIWLPYDTSAI